MIAERFAERGQRIVNVFLGRDPNSTEHKKCTWKLRFLYGALFSSILAMILWLAAVCANRWVYWEIPRGGVPVARDGSMVTLEAQYSGMWQVCRTEKRNEVNSTFRFRYCRPFDFFLSQEEIDEDPETDNTVLNFRRSVTALAIISLLVMAAAIAFTWYAIVQARYIYKRLAGCFQIGCAAGILVSIEIFTGMINHEKEHLKVAYPPNTKHVLGFCYGLSWVCFAIFILASIVLFVNSHKRKEKRAEDNPVIIGRI